MLLAGNVGLLDCLVGGESIALSRFWFVFLSGVIFPLFLKKSFGVTLAYDKLLPLDLNPSEIILN